jgi:protein TonB
MHVLSKSALITSGDFVAPQLSLVPPVPVASAPDPLKKALLWSVTGHLLIVFGFLFGPGLLESTPTAAPLEFDVSYVELSALETMLPKKQGPEAEAHLSVAPPPLPVEEKPISLSPKKSKPQVKKEAPQPKTAAQPQPNAAPASDASAAPSATTVAGVANGSDTVEKARVSYHDMVATLLARAKRYPERAVRNHITGSGTLRVKIAPEGSVVSVEVVDSTESPILDEELHRMVERASPFPAFPQGMTTTHVALLVPVSFRLEN